jgi:hypothetical protein
MWLVNQTAGQSRDGGYFRDPAAFDAAVGGVLLAATP